MNEVSTCCGCSYEDSTISDCCSVEIKHNIHICSACGLDTECTGYICNQCGNWFKYPEEEIEYKERIKENVIEERADAYRKYGE
jgi:predicted ATP-dependent serine protease|tara:strand:- start:704 stop:955 length:252 start_codon:yes stop_codon:yes gene_type:complete